MPAEKSPEQPTIARLNDDFRRHRQDWYITGGVQSLPDVPGLLQAVQDFGSITWPREKTYRKIDYYDAALQYWHDPRSPDCWRILTILLASEY